MAFPSHGKTIFLPGILLVCTAIAMALIPAMPKNALSATVEDVVEQVQKSYEKVSDFKATFVQEMTLKTLKKTEREEGVVYFKNPKRMFWHYTKPKEKKLILNPREAWLYMPDDHIVYWQSTDQMFRSGIILKFLTGMGKIGDDFQVDFSQPDSLDKTGNYLLTLTPKENDIGVKQLHVTIEKETYQIIMCRFADDYGNVTKITFENMEFNKKIPDHFFNFKPPDGVEIFRAS